VPPVHDVLDLTEVVGEPEPVSTASMLRPPEPAPAPRPEPPALPMMGEGLVSDAAAASSSAAFASLANRVRQKATGDIPMGNSAATLEQIVKELLTPMLKEWLDSHLPGLVERMVEQEVQRLSRQGH
jgi:uncharacterized protein